MRGSPWRTFLVLAYCSAGIAASLSAAKAAPLITESEAQLPDDTPNSRGVFRGPKIIVVSPPSSGGFLRSPFDLKLRFESFGGARIDPETVFVTYLKVPALDLTQRLAPYISEQGIDMKSAEVPAGQHRLRIEVKDTRGRASSIVVLVGIVK